jgi:hypothetical protein
MTDPIARLEFARDEIDRVFGAGYAADHPDVVAAVMASAAMDFAALHITGALREIAAALVLENEAPTGNGGIVRAHGVLRPRSAATVNRPCSLERQADRPLERRHARALTEAGSDRTHEAIAAVKRQPLRRPLDHGALGIGKDGRVHLINARSRPAPCRSAAPV